MKQNNENHYADLYFIIVCFYHRLGGNFHGGEGGGLFSRYSYPQGGRGVKIYFNTGHRYKIWVII